MHNQNINIISPAIIFFLALCSLITCRPLLSPLPSNSQFRDTLPQNSTLIASTLLHSGLANPSASSLSPAGRHLARPTQSLTADATCYPHDQDRVPIGLEYCLSSITKVIQDPHWQLTKIWTSDRQGVLKYWHSNGIDPCYVFLGAYSATSVDMFSLGDIVVRVGAIFRDCGDPSFGGLAQMGSRESPQGFYVGILGRRGWDALAIENEAVAAGGKNETVLNAGNEQVKTA